MMRLLAQNWWALALRGVFAIIFGLLALFMPGITLGALILLFGIYALADGIFAIVAGIRAAASNERWLELIAEGIISILAGLVAFFVPLATALVFLYLIAAWAVVTGIMEIVAAIRLRREIQNEWLLMLEGVLSIALGVLLIAFPSSGIVALVWWIGIYAIIFGAAMIGLAFRLRGMMPEQTKPIHL